jgi:hypothetical protein
LQAAALVSAGLVTPRAARPARAFTAADPQGFLTAGERALVEAVTARIIPSDETIGAREAGVADYVQGLLSAFPDADANRDGRRSAADLTAIAAAAGGSEAAADVDRSGRVEEADRTLASTSLFAGRPIFAGGPFSGRTPFPDPSAGTPSPRYPRDAFLDFVPLPRVKRLAWRVRLDGADAVPEVAQNPLARSRSDVDMRRRYREGLALVENLSAERFARSFTDLSPAEQDQVLATLQMRNPAFSNLLVEHTIEGLLCAPEYGGNRGGMGWALVGFDGDSQPLGYTIYDEVAGVYRERDDKPNSAPNPDEDCSGLSPEMLEFIRFVLITVTGGEEFPEPFCFGVGA